MKNYFKIFYLGCLCISIVLLFNSCAAGLALGEVEGLAVAMEGVEAAGALSISTEAVLIADETILDGVLNKVFIEGEELYVRTSGGNSRVIGEVTGRNTAYINKFRNVELPGDIYRVKANGVKVRSSASTVNDYNVFQHKNTGQIVLKLPEERNGFAYVELGNHQYGWMSLAYLSLVSDNKTTTISHVQYHQCSVCKGSGHSIQNVKCTLCHGTGKIDCGYCKGLGKNKCYQCNGKGKKICYQCNGKGSKVCERCFGAGYSTDPLGNRTVCTYCSGRGNFNCSTCDGKGNTICSDCNGTGDVICNNCQGNGKAVCYQCYKEGSLREDIQCSKCLGTGWTQTDH